MKAYAAVALSTIIILGAAPVANAEQVPANKTSVVGAFSVFNEDTCGNIGVLKHSVQRKPEHGQIRVDFERHRLDSGRCAGKVAGIMVIRYTPNRGYRGKDRATVIMRYPEFIGGSYMRSKYYRLKLDVK
jgi:hypothetical protein